MPIQFQDCPCSGKAMTRNMAPWVLLILYRHKGAHGYEINRILKGHLEDLGFSVNITGIYRHLKSLEQRGVLRTHWDTRDPGPAKRRYYLTEGGEQCLAYWLQTLSIQAEWIGRFFDEARRVFPAAAVSKIHGQRRATP